MRVNKLATFAGLCAVSLLVGLACNVSVSPTIPNDNEGEQPGQVLPEPLAVFLSADRTILIRGDVNAGRAALTVTTDREATFEWVLDPDDLLTISEDTPLSGAPPSTVGTLDIAGAARDPGPGGTSVTVTVVATAGEESVEKRLTLQVRRPAGPLAISLAADKGSTVVPAGTMTLRAHISGGRPFATADGAPCSGTDSQTPPDSNPPYNVRWSIDDLEGEGLAVECLSSEEGQVVSTAVYEAPTAIGNVLVTVVVTDATGNRVSQTLPIVVASKTPLAVDDASSDDARVAPGDEVTVRATARGGEEPYRIAFTLLSGSPGELLSPGCAERKAGIPCEVEYQAPENKVGPALVRAEITDAVGATVTATIPLTITSDEPIAVTATFDSPTLRPGGTTKVRATIQGGTPPYTVCFGVAGTAGGRVDGGAAGGCGPIDDLANCTCTTGTDLQAVTVERTYTAGGREGADTVTVRVLDNVEARATAAASIAVSDFGGGGGGGGGGAVTLTVTVDHQILCVGSAEVAQITASATGGSGNTFDFAIIGAVLTGASLTKSTSSATYRAPTVPGTQTIEVKVTSDGGSTATQSVVITSVPSTCDDGKECTSNVCTFGACSNPPVAAGTACGDATDTECDNADTCDGAGTCQPNLEVVGTACGDSTDTGCTNPDTCNGLGACLVNHEPSGTSCGDPSNTSCTNPDTCNGNGVCLPNHSSAGTLCGSQVDTDCTDPDLCDGLGVCQANNETFGTTCASDGKECTLDICSAGVCTHPSLAPGTPCGDPTDDECTDPDTCDGAGLCARNDEVAGTACGLALDTECDNPDTCDGTGVCRLNLEAAGTACGDPSVTDCDLADACNGSGICLEWLIADGTACTDDGNACTFDRCASGNCAHPARPNGTPCNDLFFCTATDACSAGTCVGTGNACPGQQCNEVSDACVQCLNAGHCNDTNACTVDTCNPDGTCTNASTTPLGQCCSPASGVLTPINDGVACTIDACDNATGLVSHAPNHPFCDNGLYCDGSEFCHVATDCQPGTPPDCNDLVGCTDDSCNEATDSCDNVANDANCDNTLWCDGAETCHATLDCQDGPDPCVDLAHCDEGNDVCLACIIDGECDNGLWCDGAETCVAGVCQPGTPVNCDDGVGCTDDACNEATDLCDNIVDDANCDNGLWCDGAETCDAVLDCQAGLPPCGLLTCDEGSDTCQVCTVDADCDDGLDCTDDACVGVGSTCVITPVHGSCDDGLFCTGTETCDPLLGCASSGDPCGPGLVCNEVDDSCD